MIAKATSIAACSLCYLYICYILCKLTYFLSCHESAHEAEDASDTEQSSVTWALLVDMSLLSIFMVQHSAMSTDFAKRLFCNLHIDYINRTVYNVASCLCLHLLLSNWQVVSAITLWEVDTITNNFYWYTFAGCHVLAWSIIYSGCLMMDISELSGLKQVYYKITGLPSPMEIKSRELSRYYSHMRHPSFTGFLLILWIHPFMTIDRLLLASILTAYMALMWNVDQEDYNYNAVLFKRKKIGLS